MQYAGIETLLDNLNPSKVCGLDMIPARVLKTLSLKIVPILTVIFNRSIITGVVPYSWKKGDIVAVYKGKGRKDNAATYRPISLTSVPCKILKHIIYKHIMDRCEQFNIIVNNQDGF